MIILGLTGSIGMGKSTVAGFFAEKGVPVYNADKTVHALYQHPDIVAKIAEIFPQAVENGAVMRKKLGQILFAGKSEAASSKAVARLEALIHPYIRAEERKFVRQARQQRHKLAVLDIPLLLEGMERENTRCSGKARRPLRNADHAGRGGRVDYIAVVSAPASLQRARVLARDGMNEEKFAALSARQMSDVKKRRLADFIIDTGQDIEQTRRDVDRLIQYLSAKSG